MAIEKISLLAKDIPDILDAAKRSGVTELKFGPLYVRFGDIPAPGEADEQNLGPKPTPAAEIAEEQKKISELSMIQSEIMEKENRLAQMFIEDPAQAEAMLAEGDLVDDGDNEDEEA